MIGRIETVSTRKSPIEHLNYWNLFWNIFENYFFSLFMMFGLDQFYFRWLENSNYRHW